MGRDSLVWTILKLNTKRNNKTAKTSADLNERLAPCWKLHKRSSRRCSEWSKRHLVDEKRKTDGVICAYSLLFPVSKAWFKLILYSQLRSLCRGGFTLRPTVGLKLKVYIIISIKKIVDYWTTSTIRDDFNPFALLWHVDRTWRV